MGVGIECSNFFGVVSSTVTTTWDFHINPSRSSSFTFLSEPTCGKDSGKDGQGEVPGGRGPSVGVEGVIKTGSDS